ncbi:MAG: hypothetical protein C3L25_11180 [Candidatus Sedimenticola endophacoides]|uniref:Uncharacterized protein n=1 Tax=Candidatus Sedimenticola endophacoides TaxID=2548426 RepID=A0A6N4E2H9_9GAMM|nr:MAG: hypothetical protein C3L26_11305 [Candidatus Sedimenticola endophacoides]PUE02148.1 MAG: hypothetical protein C3L25_11180 [Candidatus Sedimenticola endophacoides]PUE05079.1 MAG: hypothetical protein C3L24_02025 [Candidatus Sedimenticola endophacoides]
MRKTPIPTEAGQAGVARDNIQSVSGQDVLKISLRKLVAGRIDLLSYELNVATHAAKSNGYDPGRFERVYTLKEGELYFAFNKETADALIGRWQQALDAMKADGTHQRILDSYR